MSIPAIFSDPPTHEEVTAAQHRYRRPVGGCSYCDECRHDNMMPSHTASPRCESGKRNHCTCDACY